MLSHRPKYCACFPRNLHNGHFYNWILLLNLLVGFFLEKFHCCLGLLHVNFLQLACEVYLQLRILQRNIICLSLLLLCLLNLCFYILQRNFNNTLHKTKWFLHASLVASVQEQVLHQGSIVEILTLLSHGDLQRRTVSQKPTGYYTDLQSYYHFTLNDVQGSMK